MFFTLLQHHNRQESISPEYHRYASIGKLPKASSSTSSAAAATTNTQHTVTADVHNNNANQNNNSNVNGNNNSNGTSSINHSHSGPNVGHTNNYGEIHASSFATPPTRRRFFNHKNLRNALTNGVSGVVGHRRTASNGGCSIDTASILSEGKVQM